LFKKADIVLAPSQDERDLIKSFNLQKNVFSISPYIFDTDSRPSANFPAKRDILFIGGFTHAPNKDAVLWFAREIWPTVKPKIGDGKFMIAGSNPPAEIKSLASDDINVLGFVTEETLQNIYGKVKLVVVPLRYGAGVKGKTVEAMFHGVPVVSTEFGLEGLPDGYAAFLKSYNTAEEFSRQVVALYNDDLALQNLSELGSAYINNNFGHGAAVNTITSILEINKNLKHQPAVSL
jgi:glycosyltransferase involved in cell wall biosynthesis